MNDKKDVKLRVVEALQDDAYKGIVRIDPDVMKRLELNRGDIISIKGGRETVAIVDRAYPADIGESIIRIDGTIRKNARAGIGELVSVIKPDVVAAKKVTVAPSQKNIVIQGDPEIFKQGLLGRAVVRGDIVSLGGTQRRRDVMGDIDFFSDIFPQFADAFGGMGFGMNAAHAKFMIVSTTPNKPCIITESTQLVINPKAVEMTDDRVPDITYEDVGGLRDEIKKVIELVELPLKRPEMFTRLGIEAPKGVLLHGPPGTGKTLLAKAVANETDANFILLNGPECMSKYYGECVSGDSLIFTNGAGITTIEEAVRNGKSHKIAGINIQKQKAELLPISDSYDKGLQKTFKISTPHGMIELTPTSKLLVLNGIEPEWKLAKDLKISDKVAIANALPEIEESIPNILGFIDDKVKFSGEWIKELFNLNGGNKEVSKILGIPAQKIEDFKYHGSAPAWVIKKIYREGFSDSLKLSGKGKVPTTITKDVMYLLGLLAGDGHLRYNYRDDHVSTIQLTNIDENIINEFKKIVKDTFGIEDIKYDGRYSYYFSSSPIGNLLKNLGIPMKNKSKTISVPNYMISMPKEFIAYYLKGLFDTDGHVHHVQGGMQISYYTSSKKMMGGVKYLLLRLGIQSTFRYKKDGTYELTISDQDASQIFKEKINFNHKERKERLNKPIETKYTKPFYNRVPLKNIVQKIQQKYKIPKDILIKVGANPYIEGYTRKQVKSFIEFLKDYDEHELVEKISILAENDILWSPIKIIEESEGHVYDFTVPQDHNFIANGFIVHNSEKKIRDIFEQAEKTSPAIIFIDEIDAIAPKREESYGEVERRVVSQLLTMMDGLKSRGKVVVIGATNRPNALDPALRRPGRFDREISINVPDKEGRLSILKIHTRNMPLAKDVDLEELAKITHGFVGADLESLCKEAAMNVLRSVMPKLNLKEEEEIPVSILEGLRVKMGDFKEALKVVRPSAMREVLVETPHVGWSDVGGIEDVKRSLKEMVEWPLKYPHSFKRLGITPPKGILLYGPPGTGKTLLAKAVAKEAEANFIQVKGPSLLSMWVGKSEEGMRKVFERARQVSPCIIFFDEIDALASRRGIEHGTQVTERVLNQMLAEMDGLDELNNIIVIGATNRPDMLDPALLRPGRFDRILLINVPDKEGRLSILKIHTKNMPLAKDIDLNDLAEKTDGYSGADMENLVREAAMLALRENIDSSEVKKKHFEESLKKVRASVNSDTVKRYKLVEQEFIKAKSGLTKSQSYTG